MLRGVSRHAGNLSGEFPDKVVVDLNFLLTLAGAFVRFVYEDVLKYLRHGLLCPIRGMTQNSGCATFPGFLMEIRSRRQFIVSEQEVF